jgi:hypothetical protein
MERILLLHNSGFPEKFNSIELEPPDNLTKLNYVERSVLESINIYNPKLNVTRIEYIDLNSQFPQVHVGAFTGLIIEELVIHQEYANALMSEGCFVWSDNDNWYSKRIVGYVFLSDYAARSRNVFISQSIFPELIDYIGDFLPSPSYTIANHPIYFINIVNQVITAQSILIQIAGLIAAGINYIEVFSSSFNPNSIKTSIEDFVKTYEQSYVQGQTIFSNEKYAIDFSLKELKLKTNNLVDSSSPNRFQIQGSNEKFYWMSTLPLVFLACKNNYVIDYSHLENLINSNIPNFSERNLKFQRFKTFLNYIKKLTFN